MTGHSFTPETDAELVLWKSLHHGHEVFIPVDSRGEEKRAAIARMQANGAALVETTRSKMRHHRSYILKAQELNT